MLHKEEDRGGFPFGSAIGGLGKGLAEGWLLGMKMREGREKSEAAVKTAKLKEEKGKRDAAVRLEASGKNLLQLLDSFSAQNTDGTFKMKQGTRKLTAKHLLSAFMDTTTEQGKSILAAMIGNDPAPMQDMISTLTPIIEDKELVKLLANDPGFGDQLRNAPFSAIQRALKLKDSRDEALRKSAKETRDIQTFEQTLKFGKAAEGRAVAGEGRAVTAESRAAGKALRDIRDFEQKFKAGEQKIIAAKKKEFFDAQDELRKVEGETRKKAEEIRKVDKHAWAEDEEKRKAGADTRDIDSDRVALQQAKLDLKNSKTKEERDVAGAKVKALEAPYKLIELKEKARVAALPKGKSVHIFDKVTKQVLTGVESTTTGQVTLQDGTPINTNQIKITPEAAAKIGLRGIRGYGRTPAEQTKRQEQARLLPQISNDITRLEKRVAEMTARGEGLGGIKGGLKGTWNTITKFVANTVYFTNLEDLRADFAVVRESVTRVIQLDATRFSEGLRIDLKKFFELPGDFGSSNPGIKFHLEALQDIILPRLAEVSEDITPGAIKGMPPGRLIKAAQEGIISADMAKYLAKLIDGGFPQ